MFIRIKNSYHVVKDFAFLILFNFATFPTFSMDKVKNIVENVQIDETYYNSKKKVNSTDCNFTREDEIVVSIGLFCFNFMSFSYSGV